MNNTVFSSFLKLASELLLQRNSTERLFHELGPDTAKALGPIVLVLHAGTTNIPDAAERRYVRPATDETWVQWLARCWGASPFKHRKVVTHSLKSILALISSQCKRVFISTVIWLFLDFWSIKRADALITSFIWSSSAADAPSRSPLQ